MSFIISKLKQISVLLRSVPSWILAFLAVSMIAMNLLANKSISGLPSWLALDAGFLFSWVAFAVMDIIVKRFGAKAGNLLCVVSILFNLFVVSIFFLASKVPGEWSTGYNSDGISDPLLNKAVNDIFKGSWYIVLGSTLAIYVSTLFNNFINVTIGRLLKKDNFGTYALRSFFSTFLGQFVDNMVFAITVSMYFFGWTVLQAVTCSIIAGTAELMCEVIISPLSYRIVKWWEKQNVGSEYLEKYTD